MTLQEWAESNGVDIHDSLKIPPQVFVSVSSIDSPIQQAALSHLDDYNIASSHDSFVWLSPIIGSYDRKYLNSIAKELKKLPQLFVHPSDPDQQQVLCNINTILQNAGIETF